MEGMEVGKTIIRVKLEHLGERNGVSNIRSCVKTPFPEINVYPLSDPIKCLLEFSHPNSLFQ